jgi:hypothetical protein
MQVLPEDVMAGDGTPLREDRWIEHSTAEERSQADVMAVRQSSRWPDARDTMAEEECYRG